MTPISRRPDTEARSYTTADEKAWLKGLGTWSQSSRRLSRAELLRRYLCAPRQNWGTLNQEQVQQYARQLLQEQEKHE